MMNQYQMRVNYLVFKERREMDRFRKEVLNLAKMKCYLKKGRGTEREWDEEIETFRRFRHQIKSIQDVRCLRGGQLHKIHLGHSKVDAVMKRLALRAIKEGFQLIKQFCNAKVKTNPLGITSQQSNNILKSTNSPRLSKTKPLKSKTPLFQKSHPKNPKENTPCTIKVKSKSKANKQKRSKQPLLHLKPHPPTKSVPKHFISTPKTRMY